MKATKLPMNIDLLILSDDNVKMLRKIEALDIYDGVSRNFHPTGLFSTEIFGKVGDSKRDSTFAYIDLGVPIYHPFIFKTIVKLRSLYGEIMSGKTYAIFNKEIKDFVKSNPMEGQTGYHFFVSNFDKIDLLKNESIKRDYYVDLVEKYKGKYLMKHLIVLPAGLRDVEVDKNNRTTENEINKPYRKALGYSNLIKDINTELNIEYINQIRYNIQLTVLEIYTFIKEMLEGKKGMIQDKWASRKVFNSTRNVITSYVPTVSSLSDGNTVSSNQTVVGLYQTLKMIFPLSARLVRDEFLFKVFPGPNSSMTMTNKDTLKKEIVPFESKVYDSWMTVAGLEKQFNLFGREDTRHLVLEHDKYYFGLVYLGQNGTYKLIQDIDEVPEHLLKEGEIKPLTITQLFMLSIYKHVKDIPVFITRYPITSYGSIYPSYIYLKSTTANETRTELNNDWEPSEFTCSEFPVTGEKFFESVSPAHSQLARLGADFDGDAVSVTTVLSEEAKNEVKKKLGSVDYHVDINNKMYFSGETDITKLVLGTLTA